ncbi:MAG: holo-ACP synthase [Candidatus Electryoneaceae bacterium]|nr:holo-ACP synthase [Candidatus Electryoneaceae bacterium]
MNDLPSIGIVTGVDIVEISRIKKMMDRWGEKFLRRCFTESERKNGRGRSEAYAAYFAAKEAFAKATGFGIIGFGWRDVEVVHDRRGQPSVRLHNEAMKIVERQRWCSISLSLTHDAGVAVAVLVAITQ